MLSPSRGISHHKRAALLANWFICSAPPGPGHLTEPPEDCCWSPIPELKPVGAALRDLNQWSIDQPARQFDSSDWWYRLDFDSPTEITGPDAEGRTILGLDGLATIAQVWLNGSPLVASNNMFVAHECDVTDKLKARGNALLIRFCALDTQLAVRRKRPRWRSPMVAHQQLRWFRTTLLGRTPGWSPAAAVVGPWKDIWLERRSALEVRDLTLNAAVDGSTGLLSCQVSIAALGTCAVKSVHLQLERNSNVTKHELTAATREHMFVGEMRIADVERWWPHTHGEPALYRAKLVVGLANPLETAIVDLGQIGFRTISLNTVNGDFAVVVNGVPIFCRGACWTPLDPVTLRASPAACKSAVGQARDAGMNMLRVAGTMVYEEDCFFDACDELGVLVWQDFMFANMDYPHDDPEFMSSVVTEATQQLRRRRATASLAVLCGNSEVEQQAAMWGAQRSTWQSPLFDKSLAELCLEFAPATPYWPSSAHGGSFPHQADEGSTSYYGVGAYLRALDDARRSNLKFATECLAFANIPAPATIERMPGGLAIRAHHPEWKSRSPRDLGAGWDFDDVRDHYLATIFQIDALKLRYSDHERYLTLGRMASGEAMAASYSEWRRPASSCGGAIVLFLRDLWAGAGWGLVDDSGTPKACYHALKRVLQPTTVLISDEGGNGLFVHVVNERGVDRLVELELCAWRDGDILVATGKKTWTLSSHSAESIPTVALLEHFMDLNNAYRFGPMTCDVVVATLRDQKNGQQIAQAFHFPGGLSPNRQSAIGLSARATMLDADTAQVTVKTNKTAQGIYFDVPGFQAEDEYFHLPPNGEKIVLLKRKTGLTLTGDVHAINSLNGARLVANSVESHAHAEEDAK